MPDELKELLSVNERFYDALQNGDMDLMEEVWLKDEDSRCVHPGWPILIGWESIKESWKDIFDAGGPVKIELSEINAEVSDEVGWITCLEHITHKVGDELETGIAQTTNIYERRDTKWHLVLHHASPVPMRMKDVAEEKLQ